MTFFLCELHHMNHSFVKIFLYQAVRMVTCENATEKYFRIVIFTVKSIRGHTVYTVHDTERHNYKHIKRVNIVSSM